MTRRHIFQTHYEDRAFRRCPICQYTLDVEHQEALAMNDGRLPEEFDQDFVAMTVRREIACRPDTTLPLECGFDLVEVGNGRNV